VNAALMKDININGIIELRFQPQILLINKISLNKLIDGGADILQMLITNHQRAMDGIIFINPLQIIILREEVRSYRMLVKQNIPDEQSP
jgi:hypothetical protein